MEVNLKFTNEHNLPESIVRAVKWSDRPEPQPKSISVTTLLRPAQMRALEKLHDKEIEIDVSDGLWRLLGSAVHSVLERANEENTNDLTEFRFHWLIDGWKLNGQIDLLEGDGILTDFKITSVYSFLLGEKPDWTAQANLYRWLAVKNGAIVKQLRIVAILRDWQASKVSIDEPDYPSIPMVVMPLEMWSLEKTEAFIRERLAAHEKSLIDPHSVPCTPEERWERAGKFAVMKKGQKRSMRNLDTKAEAETYIKNTGIEGLTIEERPTIQKRCEAYCNVLKWCPQGQSLINKTPSPA